MVAQELIKAGVPKERLIVEGSGTPNKGAELTARKQLVEVHSVSKECHSSPPGFPLEGC